MYRSAAHLGMAWIAACACVNLWQNGVFGSGRTCGDSPLAACDFHHSMRGGKGGLPASFAAVVHLCGVFGLVMPLERSGQSRHSGGIAQHQCDGHHKAVSRLDVCAHNRIRTERKPHLTPAKQPGGALPCTPCAVRPTLLGRSGPGPQVGAVRYQGQFSATS